MIKRLASWALIFLLSVAPATAELQIGQLQGFWACPVQGGGSGITYIGDAEDDTVSGGDPTIDISGLSPAENDLVVVCATISNDAAPTSDIGIVSPSGYTETIITQDGSSANEMTEVMLAYKLQTSTPDSTITIQGSDDTSDGAVGIAMVLRGVDTSTPVDATFTTATGTNTDPDPASITTATTNAMVIACAGNGVAGLTEGVTAAPSGYANFQTDFSNDTNDSEVATGTFINPGADAEDPGVFTDFDNAAQQAWGTITAAIRSGAAAGAACSMPQFTPTPPTVVFTESNVSETAVTTQNWTTVAFSTADATRKMVVWVGGIDDVNDFSVDSVTIGGVSATLVVTSATTGQALLGSLWIADVPTGTSGTVSVTYSEDIADGVFMAAWATYNLLSSTADATDTDLSTTSGVSLTLNVEDAGIIISARTAADFGVNGTQAWTGSPTLTGFEDFDENVATGGGDHSGGSEAFVSAITPQTVTSTYSATADQAAFVGAAFH